MNMSKEVKSTNTDRKAASTMSWSRKHSLAAGLFYILTFVSIPTLAMYAQVRAPGYITGPGPDAPVMWGAILEIIVALAGMGTAIALFPVIKRQNEAMALGLIGTRTVEAAVIFAGVASLLSIVTLRLAGVGADGLIAGQVLVAMYDRLFLVSQSLMPALNGLLLGLLMYRSRLVPRILPILGLIGVPLLLAGDAAVLFGLLGRMSPLAGLLAMPIALWELSLGIWLTVKGFKPSPLTAEPA
jgi:hypothetical protein